MSTTTQIHRNFVSGPMANKETTALAGIGPVLGERLANAGFNKATDVLGQFLVLNGNQELFTNWLKDVCGANQRQSCACYLCLKGWCDNFL